MCLSNASGVLWQVLLSSGQTGAQILNSLFVIFILDGNFAEILVGLAELCLELAANARAFVDRLDVLRKDGLGQLEHLPSEL